jgi:hypothetical protein
MNEHVEYKHRPSSKDDKRRLNPRRVLLLIPDGKGQYRGPLHQKPPQKGTMLGLTVPAATGLCKVHGRYLPPSARLCRDIVRSLFHCDVEMLTEQSFPFFRHLLHIVHAGVHPVRYNLTGTST